MIKNQSVRKSPRLKNRDYSALGTYFVTICALNRETYFTKPDFNQEIIECLKQEKERTDFAVYAFCLMPDHLHILVSPPGNDLSVSAFIGGFKSKTTRIGWKYGIKGKLWQGRFHDHIIRQKDNPAIFAEYILNNPVKAGLTKEWAHYPFCGIMDGYCGEIIRMEGQGLSLSDKAQSQTGSIPIDKNET